MNTQELWHLAQLMAAEECCHIRSRCLLLRRDELDDCDCDGNLGKRCWRTFHIVDGGCYYAEGGHYEVIVSDIDLLDRRRGASFGILSLDRIHSVHLLHALRRNFYRAWDDRHQTIWSLPRLLVHVNEQQRIKLKKLTQFKQFLPMDVSNRVDIAGVQQSLIECIKNLPSESSLTDSEALVEERLYYSLAQTTHRA